MKLYLNQVQNLQLNNYIVISDIRRHILEFLMLKKISFVNYEIIYSLKFKTLDVFEQMYLFFY